MKKIFSFVPICIFLFFAGACSNKELRSSRHNAVESVMEKSSAAANTSIMFDRANADTELKENGMEPGQSHEKKLIKTGSIRFESFNIKETRKHIETILQKYNAYIHFENEFKSDKILHQHLTIKIPKDNFENFLTELTDGIKKLDEKTVSITDVTEEFIDINARLKIKKQTEAGYLKLLSQAKNVKDILDIQNQIQLLRSDIESIEGRLRYLENAVSFSTLDVRIYRQLENSHKVNSFFKDVWEAMKTGVGIFLDVFIALLHIWVFILIFVVIFLFFILKTKKMRGRKNDN